MTDEELIARLRDAPADGLGTENLCLAAADRIEALTKERDEADDLAKAAFADGASNNIRLAETAHRVKTLTKERDEGMTEALSLAKSLHEQFYQEQVPQWEPLEDVAGVISQIDNMVAGIAEQLTAARQDADEAEAYAWKLEEELRTTRMAQAVMDNTVADLEAKLAKAVAAAGKMLDAFCVHEDSHQSAAYEAMCAALAETERESHE